MSNNPPDPGRPQRNGPRRIGFTHGWRWLSHAADQVAQQPLAYLPGMIWLLAIGSLQWITPGIGILLAGLLTPLSLAPLLYCFMQQFSGHSADDITAVRYTLHRAQLLPLLRLGLYLMLIVVGLSQISGLFFANWLSAETITALQQRDLIALLSLPKHHLMLILTLTALPIATLGVLAWFSVPLVLFQRAPIPQVIWYSLRACISYGWALLGLSTLLIIALLGVMLILVLISALAGAFSAAFGLILNFALLFLISLFFQVVLTGAQYLSFLSIFSDAGDDSSRSDSGTPSVINEEISSGTWQA